MGTDPRGGAEGRPTLLYVSVGLVSAAALAYELLLMRLLSVIHWHHFAYMIISLALLGYGASGSFLTLARDWLAARPGLAYRINAALFAIAMIGGFVFAGDIPFNGLELIWDPRQTAYLAVLFVLLAMPFFFAANCIGLALLWQRRVLHRVYLFDLLGAGAGAVAIVGLLFLLPLDACLRGLAVTALSWVGLVVAHRRALPAGEVVHAALDTGLGEHVAPGGEPVPVRVVPRLNPFRRSTACRTSARFSLSTCNGGATRALGCVAR